jgi:hypothetical protein
MSSIATKEVVYGCKIEDLATKRLKNATKTGYNQGLHFISVVLEAEKTISLCLVAALAPR